MRCGPLLPIVLAACSSPAAPPRSPASGVVAVPPAPPDAAAAPPRALSVCEQALAARGIQFAPVDHELPGIDRPLLVASPLAGLTLRYRDDPRPAGAEIMSCLLALAIADAAPVLAAHGIVELVHLGAYKYRCFRNHATPPACAGGQLSVHAAALAIDVAGFTAADGTAYSVEQDWVHDRDRKTSCTARAARRRHRPHDIFLHAVFCDLLAHRTFSRYVTPNVDPSHANHVHLELTPTGDLDWRRNVTGRL